MNILIADDHPLFRDALSLIIASVLPEAKIHYAVNISETHDALAETPFTLLLLDLNMPDTSGLTDLALLKKNHPNTLISIVSADENNQTIGACLQHNADGYIIKSMPPEQIQDAIVHVLKRKRFIPNSYTDNGETQCNAIQIQQLTPAQLKQCLLS